MLWNNLPQEQKTDYENLVRMLGSLSGMFKDIEIGSAANKPYLYYRLHEQLFCSVFDVEDLTRQDSSFDVVAKSPNVDTDRIGVGLKTFNVSNGVSSTQKVAEFNRQAVDLKDVDRDDAKAMAYAVAELRNLRLDKDIDIYATKANIYHTLLKDDHRMIIREFEYDRIDLDGLRDFSASRSGVKFSDGKHQYSFNYSKSTLMMKFDMTTSKELSVIPVEFIKDPFQWLMESFGAIGRAEKATAEEAREQIVLPLYSPRMDGPIVQAKSGLNASFAASKNKGNNTPRPEFEIYIQVPYFIHRLYPDFFDVGTEDVVKKNIKKSFTLKMPSGQSVDARITQDQGKAFQSNPQSFLGKWLLRDLYRLQPREPLTRERQIEVGVDCVVVTKEKELNTYSIELGKLGDFDRWVMQHKKALEELHAEGPAFKLPPFQKFDHDSTD